MCVWNYLQFISADSINLLLSVSVCTYVYFEVIEN